MTRATFTSVLAAATLLASVACTATVEPKSCTGQCDETKTSCTEKCNDDSCKTKCSTEFDSCSASCGKTSTALSSE